MGIEALYRKPHTSQRHPAHRGTRICTAIWRSPDPIRFGRRISRTFHGIQISMDGTGCWRDNVFLERLWRSVKYEEVYLWAYDSISAARQEVGRYLTFYNQTRPHRARDGKTSEEVSCDNLTARLTAASSDPCEAPLKEWNMLSNQLGPPLAKRQAHDRSITSLH